MEKTQRTPRKRAEKVEGLHQVATNLYRMEPYGTYYVVAMRNGKQFRESLKTTDRKLADRKLRDKIAGMDKLKPENSKITFSELAKLFTDTVLAVRDLKPGSRVDVLGHIAKIQETWKGLAQTRVRDIKATDCEAWFASRREVLSPQRINNALGVLKQILDFGVREGCIITNPAAGLNRVRIVEKRPTIPTRQQFDKLVIALRESRNDAAADYVEFLGYSGMRLNEAASLRWADVNFGTGKFTITGGDKGTKNRLVRDVPLFPALRDLLLRIKQEHGIVVETDTIMRIGQCRDAIAGACRAAKLPRFTHHHLRHFFASNAIEQGIDFKTIAAWLGHKDGGMLVAKVYGHLRDEHSAAMAEKMNYSVKIEPANVIPMQSANQ